MAQLRRPGRVPRAGGYHHHVGGEHVAERRARRTRRRADARLTQMTIVLPDEVTRGTSAERAGGCAVRDPSGIPLDASRPAALGFAAMEAEERVEASSTTSRPAGRLPLLRAREAGRVAGARSAVGRDPADPRVQGLAAEARAPPRPLALGDHAAAPGRRARGRDGDAALRDRARPRGEALLHDDGAGRVAPHRGVAEADRRRPAGWPSAIRTSTSSRSMTLDADTLEEKVFLMQVFYERLIIPRFRMIARSSRGTILEDLCNRLTIDDGIHHGAGHGVRARAARGRGHAGADEARRGREPDAADLRAARAVAAEGARVHRRADARDRHPDAARKTWSRASGSRSRSGSTSSDIELPRTCTSPLGLLEDEALAAAERQHVLDAAPASSRARARHRATAGRRAECARSRSPRRHAEARIRSRPPQAPPERTYVATRLALMTD